MLSQSRLILITTARYPVYYNHNEKKPAMKQICVCLMAGDSFIFQVYLCDTGGENEFSFD